MAAARRRRRFRGVVLGVLAVLVAGGIGTGVYLWRKPAPTQAATTSRTTVTAATQTIQQTVDGSGTLAAARQTTATFAVSGTVTAVRVKVGDKVRKGQVLATIDSSNLTIAQEAAQAAVDAAAQQLDDLEADDSATTAQITSAKANLAKANSTLTDAKQSVSDATLVASFDAVVASVGVAKGDQVGSGSTGSGSGDSAGAGSARVQSSSDTSGSSSTSSGITLISPNQFTVDASVSASDLAKLRAGMQTQITASGVDKKIFGTVSTIGVVADSGSGSSGSSATFPVTVAVTGSQTGIYAGQSVTISIIVKQVAGVLVVPTAALHTDNGKTTVTVDSGGKDKNVAVTVGSVYGAMTQITKGIAAGTKVVVTNTRGGIPSGTSTSGRGRNGSSNGDGMPNGMGNAPPQGFGNGMPRMGG